MVDTYKSRRATKQQTGLARQHEDLYRKRQSRLFFLRRLNVCTRLLQVFYQSVVASVIFFAVVCWGGGIGTCETEQAGEAGQLSGGDGTEQCSDSD